MVVHSMDRLAGNLDDLRVLVQGHGSLREFERFLVRELKKASPSINNAEPTKGGKNPHTGTGRRACPSVLAAVFRKLSLPVMTASAARRSSSTYATPGWSETLLRRPDATEGGTVVWSHSDRTGLFWGRGTPIRPSEQVSFPTTGSLWGWCIVGAA